MYSHIHLHLTLNQLYTRPASRTLLRIGSHTYAHKFTPYWPPYRGKMPIRKQTKNQVITTTVAPSLQSGYCPNWFIYFLVINSFYLVFAIVNVQFMTPAKI